VKYPTGQAFLQEPNQRLALVGLSGVGKSTAARLLPPDDWFTYSVDYRIWTHYLGDQLNDYLKTLAMTHPILGELLRRDAITIEHRVGFDNLLATSAFMGMLGSPNEGGSTTTEFRQRMADHAKAEIAAMLDIPKFISRSEQLYDYANFLVDATGSACEVIEPTNPDDPAITALADNCVVIYIEATADHRQELIRRAAIYPKPIYYRPDFIEANLPVLLANHHAKRIEDLDPKLVARYLYPKLLDHRTTRYAAIAEQIGYTISMSDVLGAKTGQDILSLVAHAIDKPFQQKS
jgi:hypothetical protein